MKPEEIKKLSEKRKELFEYYLTLDSDSLKAKSIIKRCNELEKIERKWEEINFRLKENESSINIIVNSILSNTEKLTVLLKNSDNSISNREKTDILTDVISTLQLDKEKFEVERNFLLKQERILFKGKWSVKEPSIELPPIVEELDALSDDENLDTALKNYNKLKEEENSEEVLEPAPEF